MSSAVPARRWTALASKAEALQRSPAVRRVRSGLFWGLCAGGLAIVVFPLIDMVATLVIQAFPVLRPSLFTTTTASLGIGVLNGVLGSIVLGIGVMVIAGPIGVLAGLYIAEFAPRRMRGIFRFFSEVLSGLPSIVVGLVGYIVLVNALHWHYSMLAAMLALSTIILPYIIKTTEVAFESVPRALREGAVALGLSRLTTIRRALLPPALPGIVGGLVLAQAISMGETAPLLFTASFSDLNPNLHLIGSPIGYLTGITFNGLQLPYRSQHQLAAAAALVTVVFILLLLLLGRLATARSRRLTARMDV